MPNYPSPFIIRTTNLVPTTRGPGHDMAPTTGQLYDKGCHPTREGYVGRFLPTWAIRTIKMKRPQLSGANAIVRISSHQSIGMCLHVGGVVQRVAVEWKGVHYYLQYTFSMMWPTAFVLHLVHFDSSTLLVKPYDNRDQTTGKPAKPENDGVLFWQLPCAKLPSCNQP